MAQKKIYLPGGNRKCSLHRFQTGKAGKNLLVTKEVIRQTR